MPDSSNKMSNICDDTTFLNSNIEILTYFTLKIIKISIVSALGQTYLLKIIYKSKWKITQDISIQSDYTIITKNSNTQTPQRCS